DIVHTTAQVFLGLTLACARCHNHKFEPLTMHDYYRWVAVFNPLQRARNGRTELDLPAAPPAQREAIVQRDRAIQLLHLASIGTRLGSPRSAWNALAAVPAEMRLRDLRAAAPDVPRGYFLHEPGPKPPATYLLQRGQASRPGPEV